MNSILLLFFRAQHICSKGNCSAQFYYKNETKINQTRLNQMLSIPQNNSVCSLAWVCVCVGRQEEMLRADTPCRLVSL